MTALEVMMNSLQKYLMLIPLYCHISSRQKVTIKNKYKIKGEICISIRWFGACKNESESRIVWRYIGYMKIKEAEK